MGAAKNIAAGKHYPPTYAEGGEEVMLRDAMDLVAQAVGLLRNAAETVADTPEADRIEALANDLDDLGCAIGAQAERMK